MGYVPAPLGLAEEVKVSEIGVYGIADLHIHTSFSDGGFSVEELLDYVEKETYLNVIAITDHDEFAGAYRAKELTEKKRYRFDIVLGMEVTTLEGHLLALFIGKPVPSLQSLAHTIEAIHDQGGLCVVPHPMSWLTRSIGQGALDRVARSPSGSPYLDGLEVVNSNLAAQVSYEKSKRLNRHRYKLAETGGSDAHFLSSIGTGYTLFEGSDAADLRQSLLQKLTVAGSSAPVPLSQIGYGQVARQLVRGLALLPVRLAKKTVLRAFQGPSA